jgi:putative SOS response-associated peptidase YedK
MSTLEPRRGPDEETSKMKSPAPQGPRYELDRRPLLPECGGRSTGHIETGEIRPMGRGPVFIWWGRPTVAVLRWGWRNSWNSQPVIGAKSETVADNPNFQTAFLARRCIVLASAWVEVKTDHGRKTLHRFKPGDGELLGIAGLWAEDVSSAADHRYALLTREPDSLVAAFASRMPLVLPRDLWSAWIDPGTAEPATLMARARLNDWLVS